MCVENFYHSYVMQFFSFSPLRTCVSCFEAELIFWSVMWALWNLIWKVIHLLKTVYFQHLVVCASMCVCSFFFPVIIAFLADVQNLTRTLCLPLIIHLISFFLITVTVTDLRAERLQKRVYPENSVLNFVKKTTVSETSNFYASAEKEEIQIFFLP